MSYFSESSAYQYLKIAASRELQKFEFLSAISTETATDDISKSVKRAKRSNAGTVYSS